MTINEAISMEPVKEKLLDISRYVSQDYLDFGLGYFANILSERLNPKLTPEGFVAEAKQTIEDLRNYNGEKLSPMECLERLIFQPRYVYDGLDMFLPELAKAVCPEDFANSVKDFYDKVESRIESKVREWYPSFYKEL